MFKRLHNAFFSYLKNGTRRLNTIGKGVAVAKNVSVSGSYLATGVTVGANSKLFDAILRKGTEVGANNTIKKSELTGKVTTQEHCKLNECHLYGKISIGRYTSLWGPNLDIKTGKEKVTIGSFCSIARNVYMQTFNHNTSRLTSYYIGKNVFGEKWENERTTKGDITIKNDVWIGAHAIVLGGVTIGNGAVIAANTVVTKDVPPFAIYAGVPGKVIGYRFEPEVIAKIEKLAWWDWSIEKIKENKELFKDNVKNADFFS
ncbi:xenobiotic acyltransferase family protein [Rasiella rasia]|nr:CatB-related O-acetyltransferase [Rasiella rasia]